MKIKMSSKVFNSIKSTIGNQPSERGGMLGSSEGNTIDTYFFDKYASTTSVLYVPSIDKINEVLEKEWIPNDTYLMGMIHSHPNYYMEPSGADLEYSKRIIDAMGLDYFYMPIVRSGIEGHFAIYSYVMLNHEYNYKIESAELYIDDVLYNPNHINVNPFKRIESVVDIKLLNQSTIIGVGVGGSREFYLDMARIGVGNFILIDNDSNEIHNIASQGTYMDEIGVKKVIATKNRIQQINPNSKVIVYEHHLLESHNSKWFDKVLKQVPNRNQILIVGFTDDFYAQAQTVNFALENNIPYLAGQHLVDGKASEAIYWYPGISEFTPKEILSQRYQRYENGYTNDIESNKSPVFITTRLNAICEKLATGILLFKKYPHHQFSRFLVDKSDYQYVLIRHDPNFFEEVGLGEIDQTGNTYMDDTIWLHNSQMM